MTESDVRRIVRQEFAALMQQERDRVQRQRRAAELAADLAEREAMDASHDSYGNSE
jgi:hypothetical protein